MDIPLITPTLIPATPGQVRQLATLFQKIASASKLHRPAVQMAMRQRRFQELEAGIKNLLQRVARPFEEVGEPFNLEIDRTTPIPDLVQSCVTPLGGWRVVGDVFRQFHDRGVTIWTDKYQILEFCVEYPIEYLGDSEYIHGMFEANGYDPVGVREIVALVKNDFDFRKAYPGRNLGGAVIVGTSVGITNPDLVGDYFFPGLKWNEDGDWPEASVLTHYQWAAVHPHEYRVLVRLRK